MEQPSNLFCIPEKYSSTYSDFELDKLEEDLKKQALKDGFKLSKETGKKDLHIYFVCNRAGKPRFRGAEGKRTKPSKKIGKTVFDLFQYFRMSL